MKITILVLGSLLALAFLVWLGLQVKPKAFPPISEPGQPLAVIPLPEGLPAPVANFYHQLYGEEIPLVETAVISGRGKLWIKGIRFPARFRFTHLAGKDYHHTIELTFYGFPVLKVDEFFLNGRSRFEMPFGVSQGPKIDQGANLALWAEAVWMPSVWITDQNAHWEAVDDHTALLQVPFEAQTEQFVVRFDPQNGLLHLMESMRFKGAESDQKTLWLNQMLEWDLSGEKPVPVTTAITWLDEGTPWAVLTTEQVVYNLDVSESIRTKGP
jgi:hypothetical protein